MNSELLDSRISNNNSNNSNNSNHNNKNNCLFFTIHCYSGYCLVNSGYVPSQSLLIRRIKNAQNESDRENQQ